MILSEPLVYTEEQLRDIYSKFNNVAIRSMDVRNYKNIINGLNIKSEHPVDNNLFIRTELLTLVGEHTVHTTLDNVKQLIELDRQCLTNMLSNINNITNNNTGVLLAKLLVEINTFIKNQDRETPLLEVFYNEVNSYLTEVLNDLLKFFKTSTTGVYGIEDFSTDFEPLLEHLEGHSLPMRDGIKSIINGYTKDLLISLLNVNDPMLSITLTELSKVNPRVKVYLNIFYTLPLVLHLTFKYNTFSKLFNFHYLQEKEKEVFRNVVAQIPHSCFRIYVNSKYTTDGCITIIKNHKGELYVNL